MKQTPKIVLAVLLISAVLASFPGAIFSVGYTYLEPVAIVDETIKKTSNQGLKKKLSHLEEALEAEVRRQTALRRWRAENQAGTDDAGTPAGNPAPAGGRLARSTAPAQNSASG